MQTAEGALTETHAILQRLRDLAVQGANDSNNTEARDNIKTEADSLIKELGRIGESTNFNGTKLLSGDVDSVTAGAQTTLNFQVGADGDANSRITVNLANANVVGVATALGYDTATGNVNATAFDVTDHASSQLTITAVNDQIESVSTARAELGAYQNRFEHTIKNINVAVENLSASESRIRDTDMAQEMVQFTRAQILSQAGTAMLAQANQIPQGVLSLLR